MLNKMPRYEEVNALVLKFMADGTARHSSDIKDQVVQMAQLAPDVLAETLPDGESRAKYRVGWACSDLFRAGLLDKPQRAVFQISEAGRKLLPSLGATLTEKDFVSQPKWQQYLAQRAEVQANKVGKKSSTETIVVTDQNEQDYVSAAITAVERLNEELAVELLQRLREGSPAFFERAVIQVLNKMGYGGKDQGDVAANLKESHTGKSGDGGIDGIIKQDPLGIQNIYIQAKRYKDGNTVGRPDLHSFVGALHGKGVTRGVFITTSDYTKEARTYATSEAKDRLIILDGAHLTTLMLTYSVGVQTKRRLELLEIDEDFFE
ncbi:restriction endonuclease [Deinococcus sp.]|uniref:restriction endonuclease n=1 Tax=Deinococcus sp. TaxID=47478 RepID=UPI003CC6BC8F